MADVQVMGLGGTDFGVNHRTSQLRCKGFEELRESSGLVQG